MASTNWLCTLKSSKNITKFLRKFNSKRLVLLLLCLLSAHLTRIEADAAYSSSSSSSSTSSSTSSSSKYSAVNQANLGTQSAQQSTQQKRNTLVDDELEHEKLIENDDDSDSSNRPHIRKKRLIWITDDGRLALPPGTSLTITPTLALPLVRHPPEGFFSNVSISFPLTIDFDKLGLTDNQNPLGDFPPLFARSFGHAAGEMVGNYVARYLHYKRKRDLYDQSDRHAVPGAPATTKPQPQPQLPDRFKHIFHGGERVMLYVVIEDFLSTFNMDGKACLLRTICEIHSRNLDHYGVFGEMAKLFLTVTKSPFSDLIPEYVQAQEIGEGRQAPGECYPYHKDCPKSIFKTLQNHKYSQQQNDDDAGKVEEVDEIYRPFKHVKNHLPDTSRNGIPDDHRDSVFSNTLSM